MKRNLSLWQFGGFSLTALLGTMLHFLYDWTNRSVLVATFSSVNESTWEHMKLLYFPLLIFALFQNRFSEDYKNFWCIKLTGILTGLILIPVIFYTYNGAFGRSPDWLNIAIFFISAAVTFFLEWRLFKKDHFHCRRSFWALAVIILIGVLFAVFTFAPPGIPLFENPY